MSDKTATILVAAAVVGAVVYYVRKPKPEEKGDGLVLDPIIIEQQKLLDEVKGPESYAIPTGPHCEVYNSILDTEKHLNLGWIPTNFTREQCCMAWRAQPTVTRWVGDPPCEAPTATTSTVSNYIPPPSSTMLTSGCNFVFDGIMGLGTTSPDGRKAYCWRWIPGSGWVRQDGVTALQCETNMCAFNKAGQQPVYKWGPNG